MSLRKYWKLLLLTFISFGIFFSSSQVTNQMVHADNTDNQSVTLQINYLDSESYQPISSSTSITGNAGSSYHITPSQISNYKFFGSSDPINGTFTSGDNVINLYYNTASSTSSNSSNSNSSGTGANKTAQSPTISPKTASNNSSSKSSNTTSTTKNNNGTSSNSPTRSIVKNSNNKPANNKTNSTNTNKSSSKNASDKSETNKTDDNSAVDETDNNRNNTNGKDKVKKSNNKKKSTINKTDKKTKSSKTPWIVTIIVLILAGAVGGFIWHRSHKPEHFKH